MTKGFYDTSRSRLAWLSAGVAALFVAGQIGGFVHDLVVEHVTCPEHGEVVHLSPDTERAASTAPGSTGGLAVNDGSLRDHGGEGCIVLLNDRERPLTSAPVAAGVAPDLGETVAAAPVLGDVVVAATYRLAPKQSPPA